MPPKPQGAKPKKDPAVVEEDEESQQQAIKTRLEDAESRLAGERIVIDQLRAINADQAKQLAQAEAALKSEQEKHSAEVWLLYDETSAAHEKAEHERFILEQRVAQLEAEVVALQALQEENQRLRDRLETCMEDMAKSDQAHAAETHRMKKEVFSLRMQLEQTFRKSLQELEAEYKQRALSNLDEESKSALRANAELQAELQIQTNGIEMLMVKYKEMEAEYSKLKIQHAVAVSSQAMQQSRIGGLKRANMVSASQLEELQATSVDKSKAHLKAVEDQLAEAQQELAACKSERDTLRVRCDKLQARHDAALKRARQQVRDRDKFWRTARTKSTESGGADGGEQSHILQESGYFPSTTLSAEDSVEVFDAYADILSIWQSNFPSNRLAPAVPRQRVSPHATTRKQVGLEPVATTSSSTAALFGRLGQSRMTQSTPALAMDGDDPADTSKPRVSSRRSDRGGNKSARQDEFGLFPTPGPAHR